MKKIATTTLSIIALSVFTMSCNKEYNCECDTFNVIVEAGSDAEAQTVCAAKGTGCEVK